MYGLSYLIEENKESIDRFSHNILRLHCCHFILFPLHEEVDRSRVESTHIFVYLALPLDFPHTEHSLVLPTHPLRPL